MLADILETNRDELVGGLERRAAASESMELPIAGRRRRLTALLEEVIAALRQGEADAASQPLSPFTEDALELRERAILRRYLIDEIEQGRLTASPSETAIVSEWAAKARCQRLRDQNRYLRALLDEVQESAALLAPDGRIPYCNLRALQRLRDEAGVMSRSIFGSTPAELGVPAELVIGRPIEELITLARRHETFEMNVAGRVKEGQFNALYGPDGSVVAIGLIVRDIHSRRLAHARLSLLTKLRRLVGILDYEEVAAALAQIPIPELADWCAVNFIEKGRITRSVVANRDPSKEPLRAAITHALLDFERHPLWQGMLTSGFQLLAEVSDDLLRRLAMNTEQYRLLAQVGIRSLLIVPLVSCGKISGIMTLVYTEESGRRYGRDDPPLAEELALHAAHIFENARLMKDLKASEARFRIALASARTSVYEQDTLLRYVWQYHPLVPAGLLGKTHEDVFPADEAKLLSLVKRQVLDEGEGVERELDLTLGTEQRRHYRENIEPLRNDWGKVVGVIGAATDITEQHHAQQRLTEELQFRERMLGVLGHDLRNPLNAVILVTDGLLRGEALPEPARGQLVRVRRAASRMQEMIDTLLDFTRVQFMGKVVVSRVPADLADVVRTAIDEMRVTYPDRAIELQVHGDSRGEWDPARMAQTISNLVTNAVTYGESGTPVLICLDADARDVDLKVHNDGPPIPSEIMPVLFEPFRRGVSADRSPLGLGLGLYIVREIVRAHDGSVAVESTEAEGTTLTLHMPRRPPPSASAA